MKAAFKIYACLLFLLLVAKFSIAQINPNIIPLFTADSIVSGNTKDILTSFYQLAFNNLTGSNREFDFSSNPFAIMLKRNPKLNLDTKYKKYKPLRKLNFNLGIKLDSSFNFNGFSSGIKYSLIDQTDATASRFLSEKLKNNSLRHERDILEDELADYADKTFPHSGDTNNADFKNKRKFIKNINQLVQDVPFARLDPEFRKIVKEIVKANTLNEVADVFNNKPDSSFKDIDLKKFEDLRNSIKNNILWTIGISDTTYQDKFQFSNIVFISEFSKGVLDPGPGDNNLEINIKAAYNFLNDSLRQQPRNLKRQVFSIEPGVNWVIRDRTTDRSFFEFKFSGSYYHNFASLYANEKRDSLTLNGTLRIRILEDIWLPLEIKYDPKNGRIFGLLNIRGNFTGLGKLLNNSSSKTQ